MVYGNNRIYSKLRMITEGLNDSALSYAFLITGPQIEGLALEKREEICSVVAQTVLDLLGKTDVGEMSVSVVLAASMSGAAEVPVGLGLLSRCQRAMRQLRLLRGRSQGELGRTVGVRQPRISEIETRRPDLTLSMVDRYARGLGCVANVYFADTYPSVSDGESTHSEQFGHWARSLKVISQTRWAPTESHVSDLHTDDGE